MILQTISILWGSEKNSLRIWECLIIWCFYGPYDCGNDYASVVVVVGSISYIGLIVPNIVTMFKGDKIRGTLADTALFGALFVIVCDMI